MSRLSPQEATLSVCTQETSAALDKAKVGEAAAGDAEVHAAPTPLRFPDSTLATSFPGDHAVYPRPSRLIDPLRRTPWTRHNGTPSCLKSSDQGPPFRSPPHPSRIP